MNFVGSKELIPKGDLSQIKTFTGTKRDNSQFKRVYFELLEGLYQGWLGRPLRILFVGCSTGEEILDFQKIINIDLKKLKSKGVSKYKKIMLENFPKMFFYGVDKDQAAISKAQSKKYLFNTKFFNQDILDFEQKNIISRGANNEPWSTYPMTFDLIITRNMLIYYEKDKRKMFVDKIASLCHQNSIIVFGKSDPIDFNIQNDLVVSNHFQSLCFDERIFSLNPTYREKVLEGYSKNNNWLEYFEFVKMSLFNRFPKNKEVEKSAIQEIISKQQDPRILIIGAGQGHQVYEIAIMIAEECAKQGKNPKDTVIIALEPITLMLVDIINGRITENDLEEIDKNLIEKYFYDKILPDGVKYKSLKQEKLPKIIARPDTYEQFAETIKKETQIETDLIFAYKIMNEIELEKLLTSKQQSLLKSLFNKHTIFISDKIICKGTSQTHKL